MSETATTWRRPVMLGTALDTQGGVSTVVSVLRRAGLFERCGVCYIPTHRDGSAMAKLVVMVHGWFRFMGLLLAGRVALIHVHTASRASFWRKCLFMLPALSMRVPIILHLHGAEFQVFYEVECASPSRRFVRWIFERVNRVVVLSQSWGKWVQDTFPATRVEVIPNPILVPGQVARGPRNARTLLFLGRLGKRKGVYDLLRAIAELCPAYPDLHVWLAGDGELDAVRQYAQTLGVDKHLELLGWVRGDDKVRLLNEASIFVLPSYHEGLPMSVLEAMAYGLPVVTSPVGGIPEAVRDGEEGFLIEPGDVKALADRLSRLLADPALRARMGDAARARAAAHFGASAIVTRWLSLYQQLGCSCRD